MRVVDFIIQFPLSIATAIVAIVIVMFGWIHSYNDQFINFLMLELFAFVVCFVTELQKVRGKK